MMVIKNKLLAPKTWHEMNLGGKYGAEHGVSFETNLSVGVHSDSDGDPVLGRAPVAVRNEDGIAPAFCSELVVESAGADKSD